MDPVSVFSLTASCVSLVQCAGKLTRNLSALSDKYACVELNLQLVSTQLRAVQSAVTRLSEWLSHVDDVEFNPDDPEARLQDILEGCEALVFLLEEQVEKSMNTGKLGFWKKTKYLWNEGALLFYQDMLEKQVQGLTLLLQVIQRPTRSKQRTFLETIENRRIIQQAQDCASSLLWIRDGDSRSVRHSMMTESSERLSIRFDFDAEVMGARPYRRMFQQFIKQSLVHKRSHSLNTVHSDSSEKYAVKEADPGDSAMRHFSLFTAKENKLPVEMGDVHVKETAAVRHNHRATGRASKIGGRFKERNLGAQDKINAAALKEDRKTMRFYTENPWLMKPISPTKSRPTSPTLSVHAAAGANPSRRLDHLEKWQRNHGLCRAAEHGQIDLMEVFIQLRADPNACADMGYGAWRCLHYAVKSGSAQALELLLKNGALVDGEDMHNGLESPLQLACRLGKEDAVSVLLREGASVDTYDHQNLSPLNKTVQNLHEVGQVLSALPTIWPKKGDSSSLAEDTLRRFRSNLRILIELLEHGANTGAVAASFWVLYSEDYRQNLLNKLRSREQWMDIAPAKDVLKSIRNIVELSGGDDEEGSKRRPSARRAAETSATAWQNFSGNWVTYWATMSLDDSASKRQKIDSKRAETPSQLQAQVAVQEGAAQAVELQAPEPNTTSASETVDAIAVAVAEPEPAADLGPFELHANHLEDPSVLSEAIVEDAEEHEMNEGLEFGRDGIIAAWLEQQATYFTRPWDMTQQPCF